MFGASEAKAQTTDSFIERLAQKLGGSANATHVYGNPVEKDGVMVMPVAKAVYGLGGGSGKEEDEEGWGGGGGVAVTPVGYIEIKDGETHFRANRNPMGYVALFTALASVTAFIVWRLAKIAKANEGST